MGRLLKYKDPIELLSEYAGSDRVCGRPIDMTDKLNRIEYARRVIEYGEAIELLIKDRYRFIREVTKELKKHKV